MALNGDYGLGCMFLLLYSRLMIHRYARHKIEGAPHSRFRHFVKDKNFLPCQESNYVLSVFLRVAYFKIKLSQLSKCKMNKQ